MPGTDAEGVFPIWSKSLSRSKNARQVKATEMEKTIRCISEEKDLAVESFMRDLPLCSRQVEKPSQKMFRVVRLAPMTPQERSSYCWRNLSVSRDTSCVFVIALTGHVLSLRISVSKISKRIDIRIASFNTGSSDAV